MSSSRWLFTTLGLVAAVLVMAAGFNGWADPTGRWGTGTFPLRIGGEAASREHKLGGYRASGAPVVVMGSSRVALLDWPATLHGRPAYILAFGDATMSDQAEVLREIVPAGTVRQVYLGLDFLGFLRKPAPPPGPVQVAAAALQSLWDIRVTQASWQLWRRAPDWVDHASQLMDLRTGQMLRYAVEFDAGHSRRVLDLYRGRIAESRPPPGDLALAPGFEALDDFLRVAAAHGIEVKLFFNPIAADLIALYREEGLWSALGEWKVLVQRRHPAVDLLQEWPAGMQPWFFDPAHVKHDHSAWVLDALGIAP